MPRTRCQLRSLDLLATDPQLSTAELGYKSWSLFAIACWPRCSDCARLVRPTVRGDGACWLCFRYRATKELNLPVLTHEISVRADARSKVCTATAVMDFFARTKNYLHDDRV